MTCKQRTVCCTHACCALRVIFTYTVDYTIVRTLITRRCRPARTSSLTITITQARTLAVLSCVLFSVNSVHSPRVLFCAAHVLCMLLVLLLLLLLFLLRLPTHCTHLYRLAFSLQTFRRFSSLCSNQPCCHRSDCLSHSCSLMCTFIRLLTYDYCDDSVFALFFSRACFTFACVTENSA